MKIANYSYTLCLALFSFFGTHSGNNTVLVVLPHTIYVSVTSVYFPNDGNQPEIKIRLFLDDLQRCIKEEWSLTETPELGFFAGENIDRYVNSHLVLKLDTTRISYTMESLEEDGEAISIHMIPKQPISDSLATVWKNMSIQTDLFVSQIEEQQNLIRVRYENKREFFNLDRKRLNAVFSR